MDWPAVAVLVITYNRVEILKGTLRHLFEHLQYPDLRWFVADDGSDDGTQAMLRDEFPQVHLVQSQRVGLGANANAGLAAAFQETPYLLQLQDDLWLLKPLDLRWHVERLMQNEADAYIRLWGVAGHRYIAELDGAYWRLRWDCPDLYVASDRPHLKHHRFHEAFGWYPEGLKTAETEEAWCHQTKDIAARGPAPNVLIPVNFDESQWEHVGWHDRWRDRGL